MLKINFLPRSFVLANHSTILEVLQKVDYYVFYQSTIPQYPPSLFQDCSSRNSARLELSTVSINYVVQMKCA